jgi:IS66 C-terminal element
MTATVRLKAGRSPVSSIGRQSTVKLNLEVGAASYHNNLRLSPDYSPLFAGSDRGGERAAVMLTLIRTAKLNDVDPQAWLADVLARIADHKITDLAALLPWNWRHAISIARAA